VEPSRNAATFDTAPSWTSALAAPRPPRTSRASGPGRNVGRPGKLGKAAAAARGTDASRASAESGSVIESMTRASAMPSAMQWCIRSTSAEPSPYPSTR
jgi:hypothetical protein